MSYTIQKWDNNTTEIVYKLYAFDSDFIIQKEVLVGNLLESTYYVSNESIETIAAAWTARASKTYDYKLKENLVDNRFNRNFLALQDSYSCSLFESARKGINIKVEDFPLLWILGNNGAGYYSSYKGNTFQILGSGCVYGGGVSNYAAVTVIVLDNKSLTTDFTDVMLSKFVSLVRLICISNSISTLDVSSLTSLNYLACANNSISVLNVSNLTSLTVLACNANSISTLNVSNLTFLTYLACHNNSISVLDISNLTFLTFLVCHNNQISNTTNSQILVDLNNNGKSNGFFQSAIFGGGSLTTAGASAKTALQNKGWNIVGI